MGRKSPFQFPLQEYLEVEKEGIADNCRQKSYSSDLLVIM